MLGAQRLVVRRTRLLAAQAQLRPDRWHFAVLTNRTDPLVLVESEYREHAVVELSIRDLNHALAHCRSTKFMANAAWTVIAALKPARPPADRELAVLARASRCAERQRWLYSTGRQRPVYVSSLAG